MDTASRRLGSNGLQRRQQMAVAAVAVLSVIVLLAAWPQTRAWMRLDSILAPSCNFTAMDQSVAYEAILRDPLPEGALIRQTQETQYLVTRL